MTPIERRARFPGRLRIAAIFAAGLLALYLALVLAGGGWRPRFDDSFAWPGDAVLLFAHRGVVVGVPENSEASLAQAQQRGFRAVEIDVRKTKDGVLALFHDRTAARMLGLDAEFRELTLEQLGRRRLRVEDRESTSTVPTLREVFRQFGPALLFYLDMKDKGFEDADQVVALIEEFGLHERTILASVDPLFISYVEHRHPRVNTALERFDFSQVWLYQLMPTRWKPDYLAGLARKVTPAHVEWLEKQRLSPKRIVYEAGGTNYERMLQSGITKAIVDYDPAVHSAVLSRTLPASP